MAGKLIVFEGTDGSGKSTQFTLACEALKASGREVRTCRYPQYAEESSALVRMYLGGAFGLNAFYVALGEAVVLLTLGRILWSVIQKNGLQHRLFGNSTH